MKPTQKQIEREIFRIEKILYSGPRFKTVQLIARYVLRRVAAAERRGAKSHQCCNYKKVRYRKDYPGTDERAYTIRHAKGCPYK